MRRIGLFGALTLVLVVNAVVLAGVAWNRAGAPEATLRLTERELPVHSGFPRFREDSGLALQLILFERHHSPDWLDADKLRTLGFRPERYTAVDEPAERVYKVPPPRHAWVVLEFEGQAWEAALAAHEQELRELAEKIGKREATEQQLEDRQQALEHLRERASRLFAVDAGLDPATLRKRYADESRFLIVSADLRMQVIPPVDSRQGAGEAMVRGVITSILTSRIHVPLQHRIALDGALGAEDVAGRPHAGPPRYEVLLNWGSRHEPWIEEIAATGQ